MEMETEINLREGGKEIWKVGRIEMKKAGRYMGKQAKGKKKTRKDWREEETDEGMEEGRKEKVSNSQESIEA